jgi:hypothetical protein
MLLYGLRPYGLKSPVADMKRELHDFDAAGLQFIENPSREMEPGGGGRDRTALSRVHRLIPLAILPFAPAFPQAGRFSSDIRRERRTAQAFQDRLQVPLVQELHGALSELSDSGDASPQLTASEMQHRSEPKSSRRPRQNLPAVGGFGPYQQELHDRPRFGAATELGREDARVVHHEQILGAQEIGELLESVVTDPSRLDPELEEPREISPFQGLLGDELGRKLVVEVGDEQG